MATLFAGVSLSRRIPTYQESFWADSTVERANPIRAEKHRQIEAGVRIHTGELIRLQAAYFHRTVDDAIRISSLNQNFVFPGVIYQNIDAMETNGVEIRLAARVWHLDFEGQATYLSQKSKPESDLDLLPALSASGGVFFRNKLFDSHLELKVGFRGKYGSSQRGEEFNPEILSYVTDANQEIGQCGTLDFFLIARVGDAYVHLMWENLTNVRCFSSSYYPVLDRALRFGLSWEFSD